MGVGLGMIVNVGVGVGVSVGVGVNVGVGVGVGVGVVVCVMGNVGWGQKAYTQTAYLYFGTLKCSVWELHEHIACVLFFIMNMSTFGALFELGTQL